MLKQKMTGSSGFLPPELPESMPELTVMPVTTPANEGSFTRSKSHARRMRRSARAGRESPVGRGGWSLGLW